MSYQNFYKLIDYHFKDENLLSQALTHRSVSNENNERLEYLGDSIVNFVIAEALFKQFISTPEGQLSRMRSNLVKKETLAQVAMALHLGDVICLGSGELKSGGYRRESILADALEALIAAIYLDSNLDTCKNKILQWFTEKLAAVSTDSSNKDAKTELQEYLQARKLPLPVYKIIKTVGKDHEQIFHISAQIPGSKHYQVGEGLNRRRAEQIAAALLLKELKND